MKIQLKDCNQLFEKLIANTNSFYQKMAKDKAAGKRIKSTDNQKIIKLTSTIKKE